MNRLRIVYPTGEYVTSPLGKRTRNPALAATWPAHERADCEAAARALGGRVEEYAPLNAVRRPRDHGGA